MRCHKIWNGEKISNCVFIFVLYRFIALFYNCAIGHNSLVFEHYFNTWPKTNFQTEAEFDKYVLSLHAKDDVPEVLGGEMDFGIRIRNEVGQYSELDK